MAGIIARKGVSPLMADYEARQKQAKDSDLCTCTHPFAAHSSNGMICAACDCKLFVLAFDPRFPAESKIP